MGLRFTRRVSLFPGLRVNFSKSGASLSVGHKAVWYTVGPRGRRVTLGLPGTGLYWNRPAGPAASCRPSPRPPGRLRHRCDRRLLARPMTLQSDIMQAVSALDRELDVLTDLCLDALCGPASQPLDPATISKYLRRIRAAERALRCAKETVNCTPTRLPFGEAPGGPGGPARSRGPCGPCGPAEPGSPF